MLQSNVEFFEIFPWNENFETGIPVIDEQHKQLVNILNRLAAHLANLSNEIILNEIFDELADYADYHFKSEEDIWAPHFKEDEWYISHEQTHNSFISDVIALKENKDKKSLDDVIYDIVSFLSQWLAYHILDTDKRMAKAVLAIESGCTLQQAKIRANDEMSGSMKALVATVLTMYDSITSRTLDLMREKALRKQAENALNLSEERWKLIIESSIEDVWDWNIQDDTTSHSNKNISILDIVANTPKKLEKELNIHPEDVERVKADFQAHFEGKTEFYSCKYRTLLKNGSWSWVLSRGKVVSRDKDGRALRMVGTYSDITEQELASLIYKNSSQAMLISDKTNAIISVNPAFIKITGYTEDDVIGKNPSILASGKEDKNFYVQMWDSINTNGYWNGEIRNKHKDGEIYFASLDINVIKNIYGLVDHYVALFTDITEREKNRQKLLDQEELMIVQSRQAAMGEMINMIAHQWRQPLSIVSMSANTLMLDIEMQELNEDTLKEELDGINGQVQYMSQTIDDFRNFFKSSKTLEKDQIENIINKLFSIIGPALKDNDITVEIKCDASLTIETYQSELSQVIINILSNAKDALKQIATDRMISMEVKEVDEKIIFIITNNGPEIPKNILTNIFEPYFTTKEVYCGTGLGLYMSKSIIEKHMHGTIVVANKDNGVEFVITVPKILMNDEYA